MEDLLRSFAEFALAAPSLVLALRLYKLQRKELNARQRVWQRLGIAWAVIVFPVLVISFECFWTSYIWHGQPT